MGIYGDKLPPVAAEVCPAEGLSFAVDYKKYFSILLLIEENQFLESGV
jgi:hypothetical protein